MQTCCIDWNAIPWTSPMPGVRFKAYTQNGRKLRLVEFSRGFKEPDWCRKGHIGYVLEGEGELQFTGHTIHLKAGDGLFIPAGEDHKHMLCVLTETLRCVLVEEIGAAEL